MEKSETEIEALVLKAARGGGLPLGLAEDLAIASAFLDLDRLAQCPCSGDVSARAIPTALDLVAAGEGPQMIVADPVLITAYVAAIKCATRQTLIWQSTPTGAIFQRFEQVEPIPHQPIGRRVIPASLNAHLHEMASKTHVSETESSRSGGAGAGLTDND